MSFIFENVIRVNWQFSDNIAKTIVIQGIG